MLKTVYRAALLFLSCAVVTLAVAPLSVAQNMHAVARIDTDSSKLEDGEKGLNLVLGLSQGVPFRVFTLADPIRLVVDFREVDWTGLAPEFFNDAGPNIQNARFGLYRPGWSRMVLDLASPLKLVSADMNVSGPEGAVLELTMAPATQDAFEALAGAPKDALWPARKTNALLKSEKLRLAIDPGHGGIDPGAVRDGVEEKRIALDFGKELRRALRGHPLFDVVMTRETDEFLSLRERVLSAREAKADLFLSLHANTVTQGNASGATVYLLSEDASDREAAALAEKENRADIIGGAELAGEEDAVARILVDLAQMRTKLRSQSFGELLVRELRDTVGVIRSRPLRSAGFEVLKAPEIPSALLELGFLSNAIDRAAMQSPRWRARAIKGVIATLEAWVERDQEQTSLNLR